MLSKLFRDKIVINASWMIIGSIGQSILGFIVGVLSARYLGPSNYGVISYAASIVNFVVPITQLGLNSILVDEIVSAPDEQGKVLGTSIFMSLLSALVTCFSIFVFVSAVNRGDDITIKVCMLYSVVLFFRSVELIKYWYQAHLLAKLVSLISLLAYIIISIYKMILLITHSSVYWFSVTNAIDFAIISITLIMLYKRKYGMNLQVEYSMIHRLVKRSKYYILSNVMVNVYTQVDRIMVNNMVGKEATGYYSAAATIGGIASFVYVAIIDSFRPVILDKKRKLDENAYANRLTNLYTIIIYVSIVFSLTTVLLSEFLIGLVYGRDYMNSVQILRVLAWYTNFSVIAMVRDIWFLAENKQQYLLLTNILGACLNPLLNLILIKSYGVVGAAIASIVTQVFTTVIIGFMLPPLRENNKIMLKALNPYNVYKNVKKI